MTMAALRITWLKSCIGGTDRQKASLRTLGLRRLHHTVERDDSPTVRGLIDCVRHLVSVEEVSS
jgi:large subunit ribosomal protein L30